MNEVRISTRANANRPNHNLWLNNGTWWLAFTVHHPDNTKERIRQSLGTKDMSLARWRRDDFKARYPAKNRKSVATTAAVQMNLFRVTI